MNKLHSYRLAVTWTGNTGSGTSGYGAYSRSHVISAAGKANIEASSDKAFRGDAAKYNPEEMLVASLASCHMLWFLHLCAEAGVVVTDYTDAATGNMEETEDGGGWFISVTLHPRVVVQQQAMLQQAEALHQKANQLCFIANSVKFPVHHQPETIVEASAE